MSPLRDDNHLSVEHNLPSGRANWRQVSDTRRQLRPERSHEGGPDATGRRVYKVLGKSALDDAGEWQSPAKPEHRFFKVQVQMP